MRIRLQVQRHQLPPTKVLWNVEESATTVDLLTQINNFFPLEDEGWGLEDYAVHVGGYELLHFQQLASFLKDDDEVIIQPLQTNDIRARVMTGRRQISQDGRHLVDGVAYGRPLLRPPTRPAITIPSRRQIEAPEAVDTTPQNALVPKPTPPNAGPEPQKSFPHLPSLTDIDRRLMADPPRELRRLYEAIKNADPKAFGEWMGEMGRYLEAEEQASRPGAAVDKSFTNKQVSFLDHLLGAQGGKMLDQNMHDYDEEEEDDEDWVDENASLDESDVSKDDASKLLKQTPHKPVSPAKKPDKAQSESGSGSSSKGSDQDSDKSSSDDDSSSDGDSSEEDSSEDDAPSEEGIQTEPPSISIPSQPATSTSTAKAQTNQTPNEGKGRTRARNRRRRDTKKLNHLKSKGILPKQATRQTYIEWRKNNAGVGAQDNDDNESSSSSSSSSGSDSSSDSDSDSDSKSESEPAAPIVPKAAPAKPPTAMVPRQIKVKAKQKAKPPVSDDKTEEFQQRREALLAALQTGGVDINQDFSATATPERDVVPNGTPNPESAAPTPPEGRRARLDVSSTNRLLFNSLGVRAPKNEAERQRLQAKFAETQRKPVTKAAPTVPQPAAEEEEGPTDPEAWKSKISLSAVECMPGAEEYYYTTPPFPFHQRWDPSQQTKKRKRASQAFTASKASRTQEDTYGDYSEHFNDNGDDTSNYDDSTPNTTQVDVGTQEDTDNEAASAQLLLETSIEDTFPPLPSDLGTLPLLTPESTTPGTVIVFQKLEVSAATNWAPALSPSRTALIRAIHDDKVLELELAKRDLPQRQYDESGRRMFDKFEMITGDGEEEEGVLEVEVGELVDARVLVHKYDGEGKEEKEEEDTSMAGHEMDVTVQAAEPVDTV